MYWKFKHKEIELVSWGQPRSLNTKEVTELSPYVVSTYSGEQINPEDSIIFSMQGDSTLGMGDSIWLINYIRDLYSIKCRRRGNFNISTGKVVGDFFRNFIPESINFINEYVDIDVFNKTTHKLPAMYYWKEEDDSDKSWVDNKSILERLYNLTGMQYDGLLDFGDFTKEYILNPPKTYYEKLGIDPNDKYVFFQWHSSGEPKNLPPESNIKIINHLVKKYNYKVYVIGRLGGLDQLEQIKGVKNLCKKTDANDVMSLAINSELIVCPDSAGIHLGEAYKVPTVAIMSTLPPSYVASKYKIPSFMYGSGFCPFKPCGVVTKLPIEKCPKGTKHYCAVLRQIDLNLFDKCIEKTYQNRKDYRSKPSIPFYESNNLPISL